MTMHGANAKVPLTFRIFRGDQLVREERLSLSVIKLGKVPSAHLKLDDETVSRIHAVIEVNGPGDVSIIDLGTTRGTFVNGQKITKAKLQSGNTIVVGETRIELAIGAEDGDVLIQRRTAPAASLPSMPDSQSIDKGHRDIARYAMGVLSDAQAREMFGRSAQSIDTILQGKDPRDIAMFAMGVLSDAQGLFQRLESGGCVQWSVPPDQANTIRQLMNIAKYAMDKAVPRGGR